MSCVAMIKRSGGGHIAHLHFVICHHSVARLRKISFGNDIPVYTTFHLNQTFYTLSRPEPSFCRPEPSFCHPERPFVLLNHPFVTLNHPSDILNAPSVILNEVKDLHTQFVVWCPLENESKNARSRHEIIQ